MITMCWWDLAGSFVHLCFTGFVQSCQLSIVRQKSRIENGVKSLQQCARNEWDMSLALLWMECVDCGHPIFQNTILPNKLQNFLLPGSNYLKPAPCFCHSTSVSSFEFFLETFLFLKTFSSLPLPWYTTVCVFMLYAFKGCVSTEGLHRLGALCIHYYYYDQWFSECLR